MPSHAYPARALRDLQDRPIGSLVPWLRARLLGMEEDPPRAEPGERREDFVAWAAERIPHPAFRGRLEDAVGILLKGFVSPSEEGDPALLGALLRLVERLEVRAAREPLAALVVGGHFDTASEGGGTLGPRLRAALGRLRREREPFPDFWRALDGNLPREVLDGHLAPPSVAPVPDGKGEDVPALPPAGRVPGEAVPQISDPGRAFDLVDRVRDGRVADRRGFSRDAALSSRHADFIARAAASLGVLTIHEGGGITLTDLGRTLPRADDPGGAALRRRLVAAHPLVATLIPKAAAGVDLRREARVLIETCSPLGGTTAERRALALARWVEWWKEGGA